MGLGIVGLAARRAPEITARQRLTADTTLVFAIGGIGSYFGGW